MHFTMSEIESGPFKHDFKVYFPNCNGTKLAWEIKRKIATPGIRVTVMQSKARITYLDISGIRIRGAEPQKVECNLIAAKQKILEILFKNKEREAA